MIFMIGNEVAFSDYTVRFKHKILRIGYLYMCMCDVKIFIRFACIAQMLRQI